MKVSKRQLRNIIKQEKVKLLREHRQIGTLIAEQPISGEQAVQMASTQEISNQLGLINDAVDALLNAGMDPTELQEELMGIAESVTNLDNQQSGY
jgi:Holliday junction resolvasome RuvABC DNA-binding subunit